MKGRRPPSIDEEDKAFWLDVVWFAAFFVFFGAGESLIAAQSDGVVSWILVVPAAIVAFGVTSRGSRCCAPQGCNGARSSPGIGE